MADPRIGSGFGGDSTIRVGGISRAFDDPTPYLKQVGALFLATAQESFSKQGLTSKWPERLVPNIPGIIRDLEHSTSIKGRRWEGRPANIDTGLLKKSLSPTVQLPLPRKTGQARAEVTIGTVVPYATKLQEGGKETIPITANVRKNLAALLRRERGGGRRAKKKFEKNRRAALTGAKSLDQEEQDKLSARSARADKFSRLGFLFSMDHFSIKVRPRPFLGLTPTLRDKIVEQGKRFFRGDQGGKR